MNPFWALGTGTDNMCPVQNICIIFSQRDAFFRSWFNTNKEKLNRPDWLVYFHEALPNRTNSCGRFLVILCRTKVKHDSRHVSFQ